MFKPSKFQETIYNWIKNNTGNAIINAVAGSGKTTTLIESLKLIPKKASAIFLAFNKTIQMELAEKVPSNVKSQTLNSLGFMVLRENFKGFLKLDGRKTNWIMNDISTLKVDWKADSPQEKAEKYMKRNIINSMVSMTKATLTDWNDSAEVGKMCDQYNIEFHSELLPLYKRVMELSLTSLESKKLIDFDDQIWIPIMKGYKFPKYDWIFIDETQDLNKAQIEMVMNLTNENSRVVAVGDPRQSIYMFRGADSQAMERIQKALNAVELPLSVCYRCPSNVVELAKNIVPEIESFKDEGIVDDIKKDDMIKNVNNGDLILSRINAPLVSYALNLIKLGKKATIKGRDLGQTLKTLVESFDVDRISELLGCLSEWKENEIKKATERNASDSAIELIYDKVDTIKAICDECNDVKCVIDKLDKIFSDKLEGVFLSTVHKAKGIEADIVYIIRPELMPLIRKNQTPEEYDQEMNIKYVALTRAKKELYFVKN